MGIVGIAEQFVAVVQRHSGKYEVFIYRPGETLPVDGICIVADPGQNGSYNRGRLQKALKPVLQEHNIATSDVTNWNSF